MFYGINPPVQTGDIGISIATDAMPFRTISGPISGLRFKGRDILWLELALQTIKNELFYVVMCDYMADAIYTTLSRSGFYFVGNRLSLAPNSIA